MKKKVIINEKILNELLTPKSTKQNDLDVNGSFSNVYFGKNVVKKFPKKHDFQDEPDEYSSGELTIFKIMEENPQIFAKTKIVNNKLVVQEKLDNERLKSDFRWLDNQIKRSLKILLGIIAQYGLTFDIKRSLIIEKQRLTIKEYDLLLKFVKMALDVHKIYEKHAFLKNVPADLHKGNLGYDKNNNIKVLDFANPNCID